MKKNKASKEEDQRHIRNVLGFVGIGACGVISLYRADMLFVFFATLISSALFFSRGIAKVRA